MSGTVFEQNSKFGEVPLVNSRDIDSQYLIFNNPFLTQRPKIENQELMNLKDVNK